VTTARHRSERPKKHGASSVGLYKGGLDSHSEAARLQAELYPTYVQALEMSEVVIGDDAHADPRTCEWRCSMTFEVYPFKNRAIDSSVSPPVSPQPRETLSSKDWKLRRAAGCDLTNGSFTIFSSPGSEFLEYKKSFSTAMRVVPVVKTRPF
jgi:hypothetical protein